jgi:hypothetical protein
MEQYMLKMIQCGNSLPVSYSVDPTCTFQPGQIAQLKVIGNEVVCGVSDGTAPFGIIDDVNSSAFTANSIDEVVDITAVGINDGYGNYYSAAEAMQTLDFSNVVRSSFVSDIEGLTLIDTNGVLVAPAGTELNYDKDGDGVVDTIRAVVSYVYRIANIPGDNTTLGSGRITVWFARGIFETDQFDTTQRYVVNSTLFVNSEGKLTSKQPGANYPGIALCTGPATGLGGTMEFLWY